MNEIRSIIKTILLEYKKQPIKRGVFKYNGKEYTLLSTDHQWFDRHGDNDYETNLDLFFEKNASDNKYRVGVPDEIITNIVKGNISKIISSFEKINPCSNRVIFTKKRIDNEDEGFFDVIEFLLQKNGNKLNIITSAFSEDGFYLYFGPKTKTKLDKINITEDFCSDDLVIVEL